MISIYHSISISRRGYISLLFANTLQDLDRYYFIYRPDWTNLAPEKEKLKTT